MNRRATTAAALTLAVTVGAAATLAVVGVGSGSNTKEHSSAPSPTIRVARRTITPVITLQASVDADVPYDLTAPVSGRIVSVRRSPGALQILLKAAGSGSLIATPSAGPAVAIYVGSGQDVQSGAVLALVRTSGYGLVASVPTGEMYRFEQPVSHIVGEITNGPGPFHCLALGRPGAALVSAQSEGGQVACLIPPQTKVFAGLTGLLAVDFVARKDTLALPLEAVAGAAGRGLVGVRLANGQTQLRHVRLGASDGIFIQILSGLRAGEEIERRAPTIQTVASAEG